MYDTFQVDHATAERIRRLAVERGCGLCGVIHDAVLFFEDTLTVRGGRADYTTMDRNCLSYWFPKLEAAGLPVPKTRIVTCESLLPILDGIPPPWFDTFIAELHLAASAVGGYPVFLRTGQGSGKHSWSETCYVKSHEDLGQHVRNLVEWSECVDMLGLPTNVWAVREMLPTKPVAVCPYYKNMPVNREFRFFVRGGDVCCVHPYWPSGALAQGGCWAKAKDGEPDNPWGAVEYELDHKHQDDYKALCTLPNGVDLHFLAHSAGRALGGDWSIDILETEKGWYITDCAEAARSFHWEGCEKAELFQ